MTSSLNVSTGRRSASLTRCWSVGHNVKSSRPTVKRHIKYKRGDKINIRYTKGDNIYFIQVIRVHNDKSLVSRSAVNKLIIYKRGDKIDIVYKKGDNINFIQVTTVQNDSQTCSRIITDFISGFLYALFIVCLYCWLGSGIVEYPWQYTQTEYWTIWLIFDVLMPLSTIFQLYHSDQF